MVNLLFELVHCQQFLAWRKQHDALLFGDIKFTQSDEHILGFERSYNGKTLVCYFNLGEQSQTVDVQGKVIKSHHYDSARLSGFGYVIFAKEDV